MNLRRRQQPAPRGQEVAKGVVRPPVTTTKQELPPTSHRTETPEPRSLAERYEARIAELEQRIATYANRDQNAHTHMVTQANDLAHLKRRISALQQANNQIAANLADARLDAERARETVFALGNAANHQQQQHEEELNVLRALVAAGRPQSTDPEPTAPLPLASGGVIRHGDVLPIGEDGCTLYGTAEDSIRSLLTPWQTGAWGPRSSAQTSAPRAGE